MRIHRYCLMATFLFSILFLSVPRSYAARDEIRYCLIGQSFDNQRWAIDPRVKKLTEDQRPEQREVLQRGDDITKSSDGKFAIRIRHRRNSRLQFNIETTNQPASILLQSPISDVLEARWIDDRLVYFWWDKESSTVQLGIFSTRIGQDKHRSLEVGKASRFLLWWGTPIFFAAADNSDQATLWGWKADDLSLIGQYQFTVKPQTKNSTNHSLYDSLNLAMSSDGQWLAVADQNSELRLIALNSGQRLTFEVSTSNLSYLLFWFNDQFVMMVNQEVVSIGEGNGFTGRDFVDIVSIFGIDGQERWKAIRGRILDLSDGKTIKYFTVSEPRSFGELRNYRIEDGSESLILKGLLSEETLTYKQGVYHLGTWEKTEEKLGAFGLIDLTSLSRVRLIDTDGSLADYTFPKTGQVVFSWDDRTLEPLRVSWIYADQVRTLDTRYKYVNLANAVSFEARPLVVYPAETDEGWRIELLNLETGQQTLIRDNFSSLWIEDDYRSERSFAVWWTKSNRLAGVDVYSLDGKRLYRFTVPSLGNAELSRSSYDILRPSFAIDYSGRRAYIKVDNVDNTNDLFIASADGQWSRKIVENYFVDRAQWSPDGKFIYVDGSNQIRIYDSQGELIFQTENPGGYWAWEDCAVRVVTVYQ